MDMKKLRRKMHSGRNRWKKCGRLIKKLLSKKIGIGENINIPQDGQTRNPLETTIRHALFYCFQNQYGWYGVLTFVVLKIVLIDM